MVKDDNIVFADEIEFKDEDKKNEEQGAGHWNVLIADDEPQVHKVTELVLRELKFKNKKIKFFDAFSAAEARDILAKNPDICLAIIDVVMEEDDAGLRLVEYIRNIMENKALRIILRTGQPGYAPEKEVIINYDINDYKEKTEMSAQKLITCVITAFRNYEYIETVLDLNRELEQKVCDRVADLNKSNLKLKEALEVLQEDQEAGKKMQNKILPEANKSIGKYNFSSRLFPSLTLSGDFIDYFEAGSDHICFYMADVSGHGVSSAIVTVLLKNYIDNKLEKFILKNNTAILDPIAVCKRLNEELLRENLGKYMTIFYGIIDTRLNKLTYVNCGQFPYPALYNGTSVSLIKEGGTPIGLFKNPILKLKEIDLPEKFSIFMASDGIFEILECASIEEKTAYILSLLEKNSDGLDPIAETLKLKTISSFPDDITLMLIKKER